MCSTKAPPRSSASAASKKSKARKSKRHAESKSRIENFLAEEDNVQLRMYNNPNAETRDYEAWAQKINDMIDEDLGLKTDR